MFTDDTSSLLIFSVRAFSDATSTLPDYSVRALFWQIEIDLVYLLYILTVGTLLLFTLYTHEL